MGNRDKVTLEIGLDLVLDFRQAIDAHINDKMATFLENYPDVDMSQGNIKTFENVKDTEIKTELGRIIRLEKIADNLYKLCDNLNIEEPGPRG